MSAPLSTADLLAVSAPFAEARPLPREAFTDPRVLEIERSQLFRKSWIPVAHEADLTRPGDWVRAPLLGEHVVILRGADLELVALHAICRHRGTLLLEGEGGNLDRLTLTCPYHGLAYATDGKCLRAPGVRASGSPPVDDAMKATALSLPRARIASYAGVVFVNLDPRAPPFDALVRTTWPAWLSRARLSSLRRARRVDVEVRANWKTCIANFQESHHFPTVHPSLEARTPFRESTSVIECDAWLGGIMKLGKEDETVSESGRRDTRPFIVAPEDRRRVSDAWVCPLWLTSLQPDYLLTYRLAPLAVDRTLVVAEIHVHPTVADTGLSDVFSFWDRTNAEDRAICELQQRGLESESAGPFFYAESEDGLHAFERVMARVYLSAVSRVGEATTV